MIFVQSNSQFRKSCAACIRARAACDHSRPCSRCLSLRCTDKCVDVERKRRTKKLKADPSPLPTPSLLPSSSLPTPSLIPSPSPPNPPQPPPPVAASSLSIPPSSSLPNPPQAALPLHPHNHPYPHTLPSAVSSQPLPPSSHPPPTLPPLSTLSPLPPLPASPFSTLPPQSPLGHPSRSLRSPPVSLACSSSPITFSSMGTPDTSSSVTSPPPPPFASPPPLPFSSPPFYSYDINLPAITTLDSSSAFNINETLLEFNAPTASPRPRGPPPTPALPTPTPSTPTPPTPTPRTPTTTTTISSNNEEKPPLPSPTSPPAPSPPPPSSATPSASSSSSSSSSAPSSSTSSSLPSSSSSSSSYPFSASSVVEASVVEYTFTCHRLPDYVSDLLATYLALQKLSLAHRSSSPINISFDAKCEPFDPQPVIMLHKTTLGIVDCNLPFANFIGYNSVSEFMEEKSNFTDLITPNGVSMSKRTYQHFLNTSILKFERLELIKTKHAGTKAVTIQSHITERHTIITLTEFFHDLPMCFLAPFIKRCLPNIQLAPCRRTHCQCVYADLFY